MSITNYPGTNASHAPLFDFNRSRGTSDQSMTSVVAGDKLGEIIFRGSNGSAFADAVTLRAFADTVSGSNVNGKFEISTGLASSMGVRLRITKDGHVTKPNHPSFYARRSIAGDGRAAAAPVTEWQNPGSETSGNPNHNRGGHFDHSTGLFTAPVSGIYHFSACAGYKQTNVNFNQKFYHNGTTTAEGSRYIGSGVQSHSTSTISATVYMAAGNTMGVAIEYTHHANTTHNFFSGHLVG
jgi:hypothetical protein